MREASLDQLLPVVSPTPCRQAAAEPWWLPGAEGKVTHGTLLCDIFKGSACHPHLSEPKRASLLRVSPEVNHRLWSDSYSL